MEGHPPVKKHFVSIAMMGAALLAALFFYVVSLKVSSERTQVAALKGSIARDMADIRALEAELRTRARLPQLQRWNDQTFQLAAPAPQQLLGNVVHLAAHAPAPEPAIGGPQGAALRVAEAASAPGSTGVNVAATAANVAATTATAAAPVRTITPEPLGPIVTAALPQPDLLPVAANVIVDQRLAEIARDARIEQEAIASGALNLR